MEEGEKLFLLVLSQNAGCKDPRARSHQPSVDPRLKFSLNTPSWQAPPLTSPISGSFTSSLDLPALVQLSCGKKEHCVTASVIGKRSGDLACGATIHSLALEIWLHYSSHSMI